MEKEGRPRIELLNIDCMEYMKGLPDKAFELAIVDPPYGIGFDREFLTMSTSKTGFSGGNGKRVKAKGYKTGQWDSERPGSDYFDQLFRVSKRQIIWGGNYFGLPVSGGWIVWDKKRPEDFTLSQGELAWVSFTNSLRIFAHRWSGMLQEQMGNDKEVRNHPTQKPVRLYKWLLHNYAKEGDKILDTHAGSRSLAIACHQMGFDHVSCEIDLDYHEASVKRFNNAIKQQSLF